MKFSLHHKEVDEAVSKLMKLAERKCPNRKWTLHIIHWEDGDFKVELKSKIGDGGDLFVYKNGKCTRYKLYAPRTKDGVIGVVWNEQV